MTKLKFTTLAIIVFAISACVSVRQEDRISWIGQPVSKLDLHPVFLTIPVVRTITPDGTEIRNYVNGQNIGYCSNSGSIYNGLIPYASYNSFSACASRFAACNNIFYIKGGIVKQYTPIGTGGASCYTTDASKPDFNGSANIL